MCGLLDACSAGALACGDDSLIDGEVVSFVSAPAAAASDSEGGRDPSAPPVRTTVPIEIATSLSDDTTDDAHPSDRYVGLGGAPPPPAVLEPRGPRPADYGTLHSGAALRAAHNG